jgi:hypothetical protein
VGGRGQGACVHSHSLASTGLAPTRSAQRHLRLCLRRCCDRAQVKLAQALAPQ